MHKCSSEDCAAAKNMTSPPTVICVWVWLSGKTVINTLVMQTTFCNIINNLSGDYSADFECAKCVM